MKNILIIDDEMHVRSMLKIFVTRMGFQAEEAENGKEGLKKYESVSPKLILLDLKMPVMSGLEFLSRLKQNVKNTCPVIVLTGHGEDTEANDCYELGVRSFLKKPVNLTELKGVINVNIQQLEQTEKITRFNRELQNKVSRQVRQITSLQGTLIYALAKLAESRDPETGEHLERMREYCRILAKKLKKKQKFRDIINDEFLDFIYDIAPLHDIGKVGIPDRILLKPGKLTEDEFDIMKMHGSIGAETLKQVEIKHGGSKFLKIGVEMTESHHEKWDGTGYPNQLKGQEIPLSARILALADVYDALTSKRVYKEAFSHETSRGVILESKGLHFDPDIVEAFEAAEGLFLTVRQKFVDKKKTLIV